MKDETRVEIDLQDLKDIVFFAQVRRGRDIKNGVDDDSHPIDEVIQRLATIASWHTLTGVTSGNEVKPDENLTELDRARNANVQRNREIRKGAKK